MIWIWGPAVIRNAATLCVASFTNFTRQLLHPLMRSKHSVCPSPTKVEEMIDWVAEDVKAVPDIVWQMNEAFTVLGIKGVLNMLNSEGC
jgi:hypothetical protein